MNLTSFKSTVHGRWWGTGRGGRVRGGGWGVFIARLIPDDVDVIQRDAYPVAATVGL